MACQVAQCRYADTHITSYHKCGNCGEYGHGRVECPTIYVRKKKYNNTGYALVNDTELGTDIDYDKYKLVNELHSKKIIPIKKENYCKIKGCYVPNTHSTEAHQNDFDKYSDYDGPDHYGIRRNFDRAIKTAIQKVKDKLNAYQCEYHGLGNSICVRNFNNILEYKYITVGDKYTNEGWRSIQEKYNKELNIYK